MVQINGKYQVTKNENFVEQLKSWGLPEDKAKEANEEKSILTVTLDGKKLTISTASKQPRESHLVLDEQVEEEFGGGIKAKSTSKLNGNTITVTSVFEDGKNFERIYTFAENELVCILKKSGTPDATRYYKRL